MAKIFIVTALLVVLSIDLFLFLGQTATASINPTGTQFFNTSNDILSQYGSNNVVDENNPTQHLPEQEVITAGDESNLFTDPITVIKGWFTGTIGTGFRYLTGILGGPVNYIKILNLPPAFTYAVGAFWYAFTIFLFIAFIAGRE